MNPIRQRVATVGLAMAAAGIVAAPAAFSAVGDVVFAKRAGTAANAEKVNGIAASRTAEKGKLVPLDRRGLLPASAIPASAAPGRTYTGVIGVTGWAASAPSSTDPTKTTWAGTVLKLPAYAPVNLKSDQMGILGGGIELPDCEGTFSRPTAPPGLLCVYPGNEPGGELTVEEAEVVNVAKNGEGSYEAYVRPISRDGVRFEVQGAAAGFFRLYATWAYTAPLPK